MSKISDLVQPDTSLAIGRIDTKSWEQTERIMQAQNSCRGKSISRRF